jgi:hypothetical protein
MPLLRLFLAVSTLSVCLGASAQTPSPRTFAPYLDMSKMVDQLPGLQLASGINRVTLAFVVAGPGCTPTWLGGLPIASETKIAAAISRFRATGGDIIIAFGGYDEKELAQVCNDVPALLSAYQAVVDKYKPMALDLDIEHTAIEDPASIDRRSQALIALAAANPSLQINYTLPSTPSGLKDLSVNVMQSAVKFGTPVAIVNLMTMDYGFPVLAGAMGPNAVAAASGAACQLKSLGSKARIGITPMIGSNDSDGETFTLEDAQVVVNYALANSNSVALLSFWSVGRDNGGCFGKVSPYCSGIPQKEWDFTRIFQKFAQ